MAKLANRPTYAGRASAWLVTDGAAPATQAGATDADHLSNGRKRVAKAVQSRGLKFQGISALMSLLGQRLAMRSNVSLAQA